MGYGDCTGPDMKKSDSAKKFEYRSGLLKKLTISAFLGGLTAIALCGCTPEAFNIGQAQDLAGTGQPGSPSEAVVYSTYNYLPVGTYDSADTAILKTIDREKKTVTLYNTVAARTYTLNYDGTTYALDKYGTTMSMAQMTEGTIVDVNFYKATKQLVNIQVSPDAWTYESVTRYDLGGINSTATIGDRTYALTKGVQVFSENGETDLMNIVDGDTITVSGIGYDIYSIKVNSGHGYVRLTHDEALVGGWIEVGGSLITKITEPGMLLTVPEGTYTVRMYNDNSSETQTINVDRNQEVVLDCSAITAPEETFGQILFHVTPETAVLKMDGEIKDISGIIKAEYGVHEIEVSAQGYDTLLRYVNIGTELSEITINLDETVTYVSDNSSIWNNLFNTVSGNSASGNSVSGNSVSKNSTSSNSTSGNTASGNKKTVTANGYNRVYIYYPDSVEVYVDGIYAGLTPMSFKKTVGAHTIILKKPGFETRSYTIYAADDGEDMSISFSDLAPVNIAATTTNTASDQSSSQSGTSGGTSGGTATDTSSGSSGGTASDTSSGSSGGAATDTTGTTTDTSGSSSGGTTGDTATDTSSGSSGDASTGTSGTSTDTSGSSGTSSGSGSTGTDTGGQASSGDSGSSSGTSDTSSSATGDTGTQTSGEGSGSNTSETGQHNSANP